VLQAHADEPAIGDVPLPPHQRRRVFINVVDEYVRIFGVASDLVNLVLRFAQCAEFESLLGIWVRIRRPLYLLEAFFEEYVVGFDQYRAASLVLGDDVLDGNYRVADVGVSRAGQGAVRIEVERSVVADEFDPVEMATNGNDLVIGERAAKANAPRNVPPSTTPSVTTAW
jgi:hypothetical protein